jgi:hypothetical protein
MEVNTHTHTHTRTTTTLDFGPGTTVYDLSEALSKVDPTSVIGGCYMVGFHEDDDCDGHSVTGDTDEYEFLLMRLSVIVADNVEHVEPVKS